MIRLTALVAGALLLAPVVHAGDLEIAVGDVDGDAGTLRVALFDSAGTFMQSGSETGATFQRARPGTMRFVFTGLPAGRYAAAVFHDANGNGELDSNLIGIPVEGFAFTNGASGSFGPPRFDEAAVDVPAEGLARTTARLAY